MPEFNFKSPVVTRKVHETEIILEEVIPSPFFVEKELKDINIVEAEASRIKIIQSFYERRGYAQISTDLLNYITNNAKSVVILILLKFILTYIKKLVLCLMLMVELFLINL
jgi:hypothetical protein